MASLNPSIEGRAFAQCLSSGVGRFYFAGARKGVFPVVEVPAQLPGSSSSPKFFGTIAAYREKFPKSDVPLTNKVKICPSCSKPNAFVLPRCNQCTTSLADTPISASENLITAFILGIEAGARFPLKINLRFSSDSFIVFDDLLALSPCHLLSVPTSAPIQDWRQLLAHPEQGLRLLEGMRAAAEKTLKTQFWDNPEFRTKWWKRVGSFEELVRQEDDDDTACGRSFVCFGMNYPPSQFHLHMQCVALPLLPHHQNQLHLGNHCHWNRFFFFAFIRAVLRKLLMGKTTQMSSSSSTQLSSSSGNEALLTAQATHLAAIEAAGSDLAALEAANKTLHEATQATHLAAHEAAHQAAQKECLVTGVPAELLTADAVDPLLAWVKSELGIDYAAFHSRALSGLMLGGQFLSCFDPNDFEHIVVSGDGLFGGDRALPLGTLTESEWTEVSVEPPTVRALQDRDKETLQNYGRPYQLDEKGEFKSFGGMSYYGMGFSGDGDEFSERNWWESA